MRKRKALAMFLSVLLICSMTAEVFAEGSGASEDADLSLAAVIEGKLKELKADPDHVSIALKNTVTGEYYYYNADRWMYTASLYKLPVCMTFSHMLKTGELEPGTMTLSDDAAMGKVLEMSNNTWIGKLEIAVYGSRNCQKEKHAQELAYSGFPEEDLPSDFYAVQEYSARFYLGILEELFEHASEYPGVIDHMKKASPTKYFRKFLGTRYEIAQKYGSARGCVHAAGILYFDEPLLLVVMTEDISDGPGNYIIGSLAQTIAEYAEKHGHTDASAPAPEPEKESAAEAPVPEAAPSAPSAEGAGHSCNGLSFTTPLQGDLDDELPPGNYYLAGDCTARGRVHIRGEVNICLNGHVIGTQGATTLQVDEGGVLGLYDCIGEGHVGYTVPGLNNHPVTVEKGGTANLHSVYIFSNAGPSALDNWGTTNVYGSIIRCNGKNSDGIGVRNFGILNFHGGEVYGITGIVMRDDGSECNFLSGTTVIETKSGAIIYASDTRRVTFAEGVQGFFVDKDGNKELITDFSKPKLLFKGKKNLTAEETAA